MLAQQGMEQIPNDIEPFFSWAEVAKRQENYDEALNRLAVARKKFPHLLRGYVAEADTLKEKGEFDAADAVLLGGMKEFSNDVQFWNRYVNLTMRWRGWGEAVKRCVVMREIFPQHPRSYLTSATALLNMKDFAAAESVAFEGIRHIPSNIELYKIYADAAIHQRKWDEALDRCAKMQDNFPNHPYGYLLGAAVYRWTNDYTSADDLLRCGMDKCTEEESLYIAHAYLAMCRKDYDEAFKRWEIVRELFREHPLADFKIELTKYCKVSTIILSYNHENYIANAIESALRQEGNFEHEIIVSDDGSTDNTRRIIEEYCKKYPNIINISEEANVGNPENYKRCIAAASGEYIAILEGDDFWIDTHKLHIQINALQNNSDCCVCCASGYRFFDNNFCNDRSNIRNKQTILKIYDKDIVLKRVKTNFFSHWMVDAKLLKKSPIDDLCFYINNKKYFVWEKLLIIWLCNSCNKKIAFINDRIWIYLSLNSSTYTRLEDIQILNGEYEGYNRCTFFAKKDQYSAISGAAYFFQKAFQKLTEFSQHSSAVK